MDFDNWLRDLVLPVVEYVAVYDNITGKVTSVGPSHAFEMEEHKLVIDPDTAELIINGVIRINSCVVDIHNNSLEITEIKSVFKIDDVLHRIITLEYAEFEIPDVILVYKDNSITFSLSDEFNGKRKVNWSGDTVMNFLITDYNDPNIMYNMISLKISDIVGNSVTIDNLEVPNKFSVYTRRLFKNYVIEYK